MATARRHPLFNPDICRGCGTRGIVIASRRAALGYRRRRHVCRTCGRRWTSYQSLVHPRAALQVIHVGALARERHYLSSRSTSNRPTQPYNDD